MIYPLQNIVKGFTPIPMTRKQHSIKFDVPDKTYHSLEKLALAHGMDVVSYAKYMTLLLTFSIEDIANLDLINAKTRVEIDLKDIAFRLENQRRHTNLIMRSINNTLLRLEGQFKKQRMEAAAEIEKDFERIAYLINPTVT